ncbi:MAG: DNA-directed RNA polymerase subunit alpha [Eubacteriales bacterium]|nr:DNA-directed RNA polymerase subunit alpha [Eubacteriales bacterium]
MFNFEKPNIQIAELSQDKKFARIICEPLERGYGTTLGNSLRRIMLSSLPGYAVSQIKIEGVLHEFSVIEGVKEDVTEIIMNIKDLAIHNKQNTVEDKFATIYRDEEGVVKAGDIDVDPDIDIINKDKVICHLSGKNAKIDMKLLISSGRGYVPSEKNKENLQGIGFIPIDSIYQPVERVNMIIENTRVGNVTDYDRLILEVTTNGTMGADEAISLAAKVMSEHLSLFVDLNENVKSVDVMVEKEEVKNEQSLEMNIDELELSVRSYNCLKRAGINTVEELCKKTPEEMMKVRNLGKKSLQEVLIKLQDMGLKSDIPEDYFK